MATGDACLLDTHLLLWAAYDPARLSSRASRLLERRDAASVFSLASIWEVAIKASLQRPDFTADPTDLHCFLLDEGFTELPILPGRIGRVARLPWLHRDPFDRMLVAQAMEEGLALLTPTRR